MAASVAGGERLRLFCALRLPDDTLGRLVRWQHEHLRAGRIVPPENLHVTLAFLGSRPAGDVPAVASALRAAAANAADVRFRVRGYRETRSVGMVTFEDDGRRGRDLAERPSRSSRTSSCTGARVDPGCRTSRRCGSGRRRGSTHRLRPSVRSFRPMPLSTVPCCDPEGRSTRFSDRLRSTEVMGGR